MTLNIDIGRQQGSLPMVNNSLIIVGLIAVFPPKREYWTAFSPPPLKVHIREK